MKLLFALVVLATSCIPTHQSLAAPPNSPVVACTTRPCVPVIRFTGRVDDKAKEMVTQALLMAAKARAERLVLEISTDGGEVDAGFEIARAIEDSTVPVTCVVDYKAYSMGFFILQSCQERVMTRRASLMAHEVREPVVSESTVFADRLQSMADGLKVLNRGYAEHCVGRMGISMTEYLSHVGGPKDWYFSWDQALYYGAVDRVASSREVWEGYAHPAKR